MKTKRVEYTSFAMPDRDRYALNGADKVDKGALVFTSSSNCKCADGRIYSGVGMKYFLNSSGKKLKVGTTLKKAFPASYALDGAEYSCAVVVEGSGEVFTYQDSSSSLVSLNRTLEGEVGGCLAVADNGENGVLIAAGNRYIQTVKNNIVHEVVESTNASVCVFKDRVFYSCGRGIRFSDAGTFSNFYDSAYGGGMIEVREGAGNIRQLLPCDDAVLLFKDRAVFKLYAAGAADTFRIERLPYNGGRIAAASAAKCGRYVMFTTSAGEVYRIDGSRFEKIAVGLENAYCQDYQGTASDGQRYFRSASDAVLVMETDGSSYFSFPVVGLTDCDGLAVAAYDGQLFYYDPMGKIPFAEHSLFTVEGLTLGVEEEKTIRRITVHGSGMAFLYLEGERGNCSEMVELTKDGVSLDCELRGKVFLFSIEFIESANVQKIVFEYTDVGGDA